MLVKVTVQSGRIRDIRIRSTLSLHPSERYGRSMLREKALSIGLLPLVLLSGRHADAVDRVPCLPVGVPVLEKGDFVFFSSSVFAKPTNEVETRRRAERLNWIKRFRICLTNGYKNFAGNELDELHTAGCELFIYRWFNGFYKTELAQDVEGQPPHGYIAQFPEMVRLFREIYAHPDWILNHETPDAVVRYFEHGFVVVTRSNERVTFKPDEKCLPKGLIDLWDIFEGTRVHGWNSRRSVTIFPVYYPSTDSYYPSGRVYMYLTEAETR